MLQVFISLSYVHKYKYTSVFAPCFELSEKSLCGLDSSLFEPRDLKFAIEVKTICVIPGVQTRQNCATRVNVLVCTFYV